MDASAGTIAAGRGCIRSKLDAFEVASIPVAALPDEVVGLVRETIAP